MPKYVSIKIKQEILDLLKQCQRPGEPLSDTLEDLLSPSRIMSRTIEAKKLRKNGGKNEEGQH